MKIDLHGQIVLVTGASSGIGESVAQCLAEYGATIAVHCNKNVRHAEKVAHALGHNAAVFQADLSESSKCTALFRSVVRKYKRVHALVNNAGIYESSPLSRDDGQWIKDWQRTIETNLTSTGILCREAVLHFKRTGGGRIVNIASRAAFRGDDKDHWAYAASKAGMVALNRTIARAYGKENIYSFVVAPGYVWTPMTEDYFRKNEKKFVATEIAMNRVAMPHDVAPTVVFLLSGLMDHSTGNSVDINSGSYVR
jgi:3-oxoacyl-[acyl-carrier protein] reductase